MRMRMRWEREGRERALLHFSLSIFTCASVYFEISRSYVDSRWSDSSMMRTLANSTMVG